MINYVKAEGPVIERLVQRIERAVEGEESAHIAMASLVMCILAQEPNVPVDKLTEAVKGASEWIAAYLADTGGVIN